MVLLSSVAAISSGLWRNDNKEFMGNWLRFLQAAASEDRITCAELSRILWYLTGEEMKYVHLPLIFIPRAY